MRDDTRPVIAFRDTAALNCFQEVDISSPDSSLATTQRNPIVDGRGERRDDALPKAPLKNK